MRRGFLLYVALTVCAAGCAERERDVSPASDLRRACSETIWNELLPKLDTMEQKDIEEKVAALVWEHLGPHKELLAREAAWALARLPRYEGPDRSKWGPAWPRPSNGFDERPREKRRPEAPGAPGGRSFDRLGRAARYFREENRVLRERPGHKRIILNEAQKRRLATAACSAASFWVDCSRVATAGRLSEGSCLGGPARHVWACTAIALGRIRQPPNRELLPCPGWKG